MVQTEGGVNSPVTSVAVIASDTSASGTGVGAQLVRCLVGQRERVTTVSVVDAGTSSGALSCIVQGSLDGTNWVAIGTAVTTETVFTEVVTATPWVRLYITTQGANPNQWEMSLTVTE